MAYAVLRGGPGPSCVPVRVQAACVLVLLTGVGYCLLTRSRGPRETVRKFWASARGKFGGGGYASMASARPRCPEFAGVRARPDLPVVQRRADQWLAVGTSARLWRSLRPGGSAGSPRPAP